MEEQHMRRALELAAKGKGFVSPNPLVGALIIKNDRVIGEGYHEVYGGNHAEIEALNSVVGSAEGATLYVTLEPCCHYGKTPPCTKAIIDAGITKVVIAMKDPNPLVAGKGIKQLQDAGIEVIVGVLEEDAKCLNKIFIKHMNTGLPYVIMKYAMTLDGKIASFTGDSKWITGGKAREHVHLMRHELSAIMVGINTVLADDPLLTVRIKDMKVKQPKAVILDSKCSIPMNAKILNTLADREVIIATTQYADLSKIKRLEELGVHVLVVNHSKGRVHMPDLLKKLGDTGIDSILVEGGGAIHGSLLDAKLVDYVMAYISPKLIGGKSSSNPIGGRGIEKMVEAIRLNQPMLRTFEEDILIEGEVFPCLQDL